MTEPSQVPLVEALRNDATKEESDAWAASPEGQAVYKELLKGRRGAGS